MQLILEASGNDKEELERITFDLEIASANLAQSTRELEEMRVIIDTKPVPAIFGDGSEPVDRNLLNKLILRCRE
eukprot:1757759-Heterocapsa_arctica.AAC.1